MRRKPAIAFWYISVEFTRVSIGVQNSEMYSAKVAISTAESSPRATSQPPMTATTVYSAPVIRP